MLTALQSEQFAQIPHIKHGFFSRNGGVSTGVYASLNCGLGSHDAPENVAENRKRVAQYFGAQPEQLYSLRQIHSTKVVTIEQAGMQLPEADAMVTNQPDILLGILTADCAPVMFADSKQKIIGVAHAGWPGAFKGILEATIQAMEQLGSNISDIHACIGPCIAQSSYEVGAEFYDRFVQESAQYKEFFLPSNPEKFHFDLKAFIVSRLAKAGISNINMLANDTCAEENLFFSYRYNTLRGEKKYGRQISVIGL